MKKQVDFPDLSLWGLNISSLKELSRPWQKFFARLSEINDISISEWKHYHMLSYFLKRFHETYGFSYGLSFKGSPLNCEEIFFMKKMFANLSTESPKIAKEYIDWCFDEKAVKRKMPIQKIGFLLTTGFITEFLRIKKQKSKVTFFTKLSDEYLKPAQNLDISVETYGDLKFLVDAYQPKMLAADYFKYKDEKKYFDYLIELEKLSFDFSMLSNLERN